MVKETLQKSIYTLHRAKDKQMQYTQTFNLINHQSKLYQKNPMTQAPMTTNLTSGYNIVSNLDFADHHYLAPENRPDRLTNKTKTKDNQSLGRRTFVSTAPTKNFNMISNRYLHDHSTQSASDQHAAKLTASRKYWLTHDFDPLRTQYYAAPKERAFQAERLSQTIGHGQVQAGRLPPAEKQSEGRALNIINKSVKDHDKLERMNARQDRGIKTKVARAIESRLQREAEVTAKVRDTRSLNRMSAQREVERTAHGYDLVTHQPYVGRTGKILPKGRENTKKTLPVWRWLEEQQIKRQNMNQDMKDPMSRARKETKPRGHEPDILVVEHPPVQEGGLGSTRATTVQNNNSVPLERESRTRSSSGSSLIAVPPINIKQAQKYALVRTGGF